MEPCAPQMANRKREVKAMTPTIKQPLTLSQPEVTRALKEREITLVRPMEPSDEPDWVIPMCDPEAGSPFGPVGSLFWVREEWHSDVTQSQYEDVYGGSGVFYKATEIEPDIFFWKEASTMPQWASRLTLRLKSIEVKQTEGIWNWIASMEVVE